MPAPTPPTTISPSWMLISGIMPPSAVKLSCIALTAPARGRGGDDREERAGGDAEADLLALHVAARHAELVQHGVARGLLPIGDGDAGEEDRQHRREDRPALALVAHRLAKVQVRPKPITKIDSICTRLVSAVGFSKGCALLALKKPPPLVPSILIASCEATGPSTIDCFAPSIVVASTTLAKVCGTPLAIR